MNSPGGCRRLRSTCSGGWAVQNYQIQYTKRVTGQIKKEECKHGRTEK